MKYLSIEQIIKEHEKLINNFGGSHGIRDKQLQFQTALEYPRELFQVVYQIYS